MRKPTMWFPTRYDKLACTSTDGNFGFSKSGNCSILVAKTKALISFAVTAKLICAFGFAYADFCICRFSHEAAQRLGLHSAEFGATISLLS